MKEYIEIDGRVRFHRIAGEASEEMLRDWTRMSFSERERLAIAVYEFHNTLTTAGRAQILAWLLETSNAYITQYLAFGNGPIVSVSAGDTSVPGEFARLANTATGVIVGTQVDIQFSASTSQANGTYTNVGLFGLGATSTLGSGTLCTHLPANFSKTSAISLVSDYL